MPKNMAPPDPIRPEMLFTELNGGVIDETDYLAQAVAVLDSMPEPSDDRLLATEAIHWSDRQQLIEDMEPQNGYTKFSDGCWYIAHDVYLQNITADMFTWWLNYCDDNEKFRWWHPRNHLQGGWDPQFYSVPMYERFSDHFVGHSHVIKHALGKFRSRFHNLYLRVENYFDTSKFDEQNVKGCILARSHAYNPSYGDVAFGYLLYMLVEDRGRLFLRTRYWLGSFEKTDGGKWFNYFANTWIFRKMNLKAEIAKALYRHILEQTACLGEFLPKLYRRQSEVRPEVRPFVMSAVSSAGRSPPIGSRKATSAAAASNRGIFFDANEDEDDDDEKNDARVRADVEAGGQGPFRSALGKMESSSPRAHEEREKSGSLGIDQILNKRKMEAKGYPRPQNQVESRAEVDPRDIRLDDAAV